MNIETAVQLVHELVKAHPTLFDGVIVKHEFGEIPRPFIGDDSNADFRGMLGGHDAAIKSGVYLFSAQDDEVIYVGKATKNNLHARITSHLGTPTRLENGWMTFPSTSFSQCPERPDIVKHIRDGEIRLHVLSVSDENVISFIEVYLQTMFVKIKERRPYFNKQIG